MVRKICVFCGSNKPNNNNEIENEVKTLGKLLIDKKIDLVYGGAKIGLMGIIADTILLGGGYVTGIIPRILSKKEIINEDVSKLIIVETMHERKKKMYDISDAFIVLPGGIGTLEEFSEILTWKILGIKNKPIFVLNLNGYYDFLLNQFQVMKENNFLYSDIYKEITIIKNIKELEKLI
ncbi:MAG: TIGR00730 family Rossman fold protein [Flammeovirgaceae bacterium]|nr:TIGR00730 family Rossman fold protein [Flammeovirgaceae bacterium]|tara:strand:- start:1507 stop:2043 length:537 start_codon:yes stop_codon:yes gene_type:complete